MTMTPERTRRITSGASTISRGRGLQASRRHCPEPSCPTGMPAVRRRASRSGERACPIGLLGAARAEFARGEAVHTEDSHKYTIESFREMAVKAGFQPRAVWTDEERLFSIHWLESR